MQVEPGVIKAAKNFKRNLLLVLYREEKKYLTLVPLPLKREIKKRLALAAYFLHLGAPSLPACYPLILLGEFSLGELPRERGIVLVL